MSISQIVDKTSAGQGRPVDVLVVETLVPHPFRESASISREARYADAEVVVDFENLLLVRRQFGDRTLESSDD